MKHTAKRNAWIGLLLFVFGLLAIDSASAMHFEVGYGIANHTEVSGIVAGIPGEKIVFQFYSVGANGIIDYAAVPPVAAPLATLGDISGIGDGDDTLFISDVFLATGQGAIDFSNWGYGYSLDIPVPCLTLPIIA